MQPNGHKQGMGRNTGATSPEPRRSRKSPTRCASGAIAIAPSQMFPRPMWKTMKTPDDDAPDMVDRYCDRLLARVDAERTQEATERILAAATSGRPPAGQVILALVAVTAALVAGSPDPDLLQAATARLMKRLLTQRLLA